MEAIHDLLRAKVRTSRGRSDKKIKGRKRHIAVDTLGLLVVLALSAASVHDSAAGARTLEHVAAVAPTATSAFVDHGRHLGIGLMTPIIAARIMTRAVVRWVS